MANESKGTPKNKPATTTQVQEQAADKGSEIEKDDILRAYRGLLSLEDEFHALKKRLSSKEEAEAEAQRIAPQPEPKIAAPRPVVKDQSGQDIFQRLDYDKVRLGIWRRMWLILTFAVAFAVLGSMASIWLSQTYQSTAILVHVENGQARTAEGLRAEGFNVQTTAEIVTAPQQFEAVRAVLGLDLSNEQLQSMVDVVSSRTSKLLRINTTAESPELATDLANALARVAVHSSENRYYEHARNAFNYFSAEEEEARKKVEELTQQISDFKSEAKFVEMDLENQAVTTAVAMLQRDYRDSALEYEELLVEYENLQREIDRLPEHVVRYEYDENPIRSRINHKEMSLLEARTKYGPENPKVLLLEEEIKQLRRALSETAFDDSREQVYEKNVVKEQLNLEALRMQGKLRASQKKKQSLAGQLREIDVKFQEVPQVQQEYAKLLRQLNTAQEEVTRLSATSREAESSMERQSSDLQVFELASSASQKYSYLVKGLPLIGLLVGAAFGLFFVLLNEVTDKRVRTPGQIKKAYSVPHLMSIPKISGLNKQSEDKMLFYTRTLTERINQLSQMKSFQTIVLTSSRASEGKSTIGYHLATYYKQLGMKTAYVDFDHRKNPHLNTVPVHTIDRYLRGRASFKDLIYEGAVDVLKTGDDPQLKELLVSGELEKLWDELKASYDIIIVESPGIIDDPCAVNIAGLGDLCLHVIGSAKVPKRFVDSSLEELEKCGVRPEGIILNQVHPSYIEDPRIIAHQKSSGWRSMFYLR